MNYFESHKGGPEMVRLIMLILYKVAQSYVQLHQGGQKMFNQICFT